MINLCCAFIMTAMLFSRFLNYHSHINVIEIYDLIICVHICVTQQPNICTIDAQK